jgi:hypothetical protein
LVAINDIGVLTIIMDGCGRREAGFLDPQSGFHRINCESRVVEHGHIFLHGEQSFGIVLEYRAGRQSDA